MTMTNQSDIKCRTCGQTYDWHLDRVGTIRHPFNPPDTPLPTAETFGKRLPDGTRADATPTKVEEAPWPFDPVLRQALMDKGVITPDDLTRAERTIRAVTASVQQEDQSVYVYAADGSPVHGLVSRNDVFTGKIVMRTEYELKENRS
jgi:hypothetical protein